MSDALFLAGDRYHDAKLAHSAIGPILEAAGLDVTYTTDFASIDSESLAGKKLLVFHRDGMEWPNGHEGKPEAWMQPHQEEAIEEFVQNGGSFFALHNSGWAYPWQGGYRRVLGGYFQFHPPFQTFNVYVVDGDQPITEGISDYEIEDEQHFIWYDPDGVHLLLRSQGDDGRESAAGWAREYGKGRVVYQAQGHRQVSLEHPMVQRLHANAVRWLLRA